MEIFVRSCTSQRWKTLNFFCVQENSNNNNNSRSTAGKNCRTRMPESSQTIVESAVEGGRVENRLENEIHRISNELFVFGFVFQFRRRQQTAEENFYRQRRRQTYHSSFVAVVCLRAQCHQFKNTKGKKMKKKPASQRR